MAALCRNRLHPREGNRAPNSGRPGTFCVPCRRESVVRRGAAAPVRLDGWADPIGDTERRQRLAVWIAGVDDAIARIRAEEGFDGTVRTWRTLGECLSAEPPRLPTRLNPHGGRRLVHCGRCGAPRWYGQPCALCAAGVETRKLVG